VQSPKPILALSALATARVKRTLPDVVGETVAAN
jgi:hypothetical protein